MTAAPGSPPDGRLPRGRHQLSREQVHEAQRGRMLLAIAEAMSRKGYVNTTVADVITGARVSRETFYQQFSSKLDCFLAAFDAAADLLMAEVGDVLRLDGTPLQRFEAALLRYLDALAAQPAFARVFLVEVYAAGADAIDRRIALQGRIVDSLVDLLDAHTEAGRFACELLVAGTGSLVTGPLVADDLDAVRALAVPVVDLVGRVLATRPPPP
jgi:AcrR family transcriptional regulator